jgi:sialic acid synthase SpsE
MTKRTMIIAEAGVNHNGNLNLAKKLIDAAASSGADVVKFQNYKTELLIQKELDGKKIGLRNYRPQKVYNLLKKYEFNYSDFQKLKKYSIKKKIIFTATPFDKKSVEELQKLKVPFFKISSGDVNNFQLIEYIVKKKKPIILSTGRCNLDEVTKTVSFLKKLKCKNFTLLHCTSEYPAEYKNLNLYAIRLLRKKFKCRVGYSDHSKGIEAALAAVAIGANCIEKHLTLNVNFKGPDHKASIEPSEFKKMVEGIKKLDLALGSEKKMPTKSELLGRFRSRRSIFASRNLLKNTKIKDKDIICKRPAVGILPENFQKVIGSTTKKNIRQNESITWKKIKIVNR